MQCNDSSIMLYDSKAEVNRLGGYCVPTDKYLYSKAIHHYNIKDKLNFIRSYDNVKISLGVALLLGTVFLALVQCMPKTMSWLVILLSAVGCLILAVLLFRDKSPSLLALGKWVPFLGLLLLLFAVGLIFNILWNRYTIKISGIFLDYSTRMLRQNWFLLAMVLLFLLLSFGLVALTIFEYLAFSSRPAPILEKDDIYWNAQPVNFGIILVLVQFIWGLSFLRDACTACLIPVNYIISGYTVRWYFVQSRVECYTPWSRLLRFNFGTVVGGSFLNALLLLPDLVLSVLRVRSVLRSVITWAAAYKSANACTGAASVSSVSSNW